MNTFRNEPLWQRRLLMEHTLIITVGISGSGKTTYVQKNYPKHTIVSTDSLREQFTGDINDQSVNKRVFQESYRILKEKIANGNVVFDATNVELNYLDELISEITPTKIRFLVFDTPLETCKKRIKADLAAGKNRSNVPEYVIERQHQHFCKTVHYLKYYSNDIEWIKPS